MGRLQWAYWQKRDACTPRLRSFSAWDPFAWSASTCPSMLTSGYQTCATGGWGQALHREEGRIAWWALLHHMCGAACWGCATARVWVWHSTCVALHVGAAPLHMCGAACWGCATA
eukprot:358842-Chlamydomonas_euryale.AAC.1